MKRLAITTKIESLLRASYGPDADISKLAVFEFVAANTMPLRKRSGIYEKARFSEGALREMLGLVGKESIQLILNHNDQTMPVGRVFAGELKGEDLHVLVGIPTDTQANLVADIESGTLDQVSVGILPATLLCSECGFDYMGDEATMDNWWTLTCNEGHTIGEDAHARITSIASWFEMSLVGMGAVPGARSVPKENSAFSEGQFQRLAASGVPAHILACSCSVEQPKPKEEPTMDLKEFSTQLTAAVTDKVAAEAKLTAAENQVTALTATVAERDATIVERDTRITELEATVAAAPSKESYDAMLSALKDVTKKARVALGEQVAEEDLPDDVTALIEMFEGAQTKLTAIIPKEAVSSPADQPAKLKATPSAHAFTTAL